MARMRILVVEDHRDMQKFYDHLLRRVSHEMPLEYFLAPDVPGARKILKHQSVDFMILDWMMPGSTGLEFLKEIRQSPEHKNMLVIMVTARAMAKDCAEALDSGADDFLAKPFSVDVLLAKLRSLARRQERPWQAPKPIASDGIRLDPASGTVTVAGSPVYLHPKEMLLLEVFLRHPGVLHPAEVLWDRIWGCDADNWRHRLTVAVSHLKKCLGPRGARLQARRGLGYIFNP